MRVGIVGCGLIGTIYARTVLGLGHELVAVVDTDNDRSAALADETGAARFRTAEDMLAAGTGLEAVGISTPPSDHPALVTLCAAHGLPVLCEKPLALSLAAAEAALDAVAAARIRLAVGFKMRFEPLLLELRSVLETGAIGRLRYLHVTHYQPLPRQPWARAEGVTHELLCHSVDLCRWLFAAEPTAVEGRLTAMPGAGEDTARIRLSFGAERDALIAGGWLPDFPQIGGDDDFVLQAVGERGYAVAHRPEDLILRTASGRRTYTVPRAEYAAPFVAEWEAFFALLATGDGGDLAIEDDALAVQRVLETALRTT